MIWISKLNWNQIFEVNNLSALSNFYSFQLSLVNFETGNYKCFPIHKTHCGRNFQWKFSGFCSSTWCQFIKFIHVPLDSKIKKETTLFLLLSNEKCWPYSHEKFPVNYNKNYSEYSESYSKVKHDFYVIKTSQSTYWYNDCGWHFWS